MKKEEIIKSIEEYLKDISFKEKVEAINEIREAIHLYSPFKNEPVDFVKWVVNDNVVSND